MKAYPLYFAASVLVLAAPAAAQTDRPTPDAAGQAQQEPLAQDGEQPGGAEAEQSGDVVVTAVARGTNRLDSSVSVSSLGQDEIQKSAPRSVAEIFRQLPGIRSESSGGEGNANIAVRGLPVASGGAKFLQLQEDGLPILEFGDITFGNADIFLRSDFNVARVEAVRGGSASTFASNSPGGVINLISKTGDQQGGSIQGTVGLDYEEYRIDGDYGGRLSDSLRFHIGGFYRQGEGPRRAGYDGNKGGQVKANVTHQFGGGFLRVYAKYLNDRAIGYLPNPVLVTGTNGDPDYSNVPGFSINGDTLHSRYFTRNLGLGDRNTLTTRDIRDGQHPVVFAAGFEVQADLSGWQVTNRFRFSDVSGRFISNFPASVDTAAATATALGGAGSTIRYSNGPNAGQAVPAGQLVASIVVFDTKLNSLDNVTNDLRIGRDFDFSGGTLNVTGGLYASRQEIDTAWLWTSALLEVRGNGNAALIDVRGPAGQVVTQDGFYGYGARFFGNCCRRRYDVRYDTLAPFASATFNSGGLTIDGSLRWDNGHANGNVYGSDLGGGRVGITTVDVNGNGVIVPPETQVAFIPYGQPGRVNYDYDYLSYSVGVNYRFRDDLSAFARYSRGARANADRLLFGPAVDAATGRLVDPGAAVDFVNQAEGGFKYREGGIALFATAFYAKTQEGSNFEATTQRFLNRRYRAYGLELEGSIRRGPFSLSAGGTYTDAEITRDFGTPANDGNRPRRQAKFIFQATPQIDMDRFTVGANVIGTTDSYAQDNNLLKLPGFTQVNAFAQVRLMDRVQLSVNANNLFDVKGFTEAEEGAIPANGIVRARSINGRTVSAAVRLDF